MLGGQLTIGVTGLFGRSSASIAGTLTTAVGPLAETRRGFLGDSVTSVGDLYTQAALKWNAGVHNLMTYVTGDIPVGAYDSTCLANLGIGHGTIGGGVWVPAITDDFGAHPLLGGFRSRVLVIGPQIGFLFPAGDMQGYLNLKG